MRQRVLVTGGAGFIGSHITDLLIERGHRAVVFDNESTGRREHVHPDASFVHGDVRQAAQLARVFDEGLDAVIHIAGQASIRKSFADPAVDLAVNTVGTLNILNLCLQHRVPRLLFASSMTIYGTPQIVPTPETAIPNPVSYYAVTKYAAERYVHITAEREDLDFDFRVTSFRMFNVYGPRQSLTNPYQGVLAIFTGNMLRNEPIEIHSDGEQSRDFVFVQDVARAWVDALEEPAAYGQIINLGTGMPTTVNTLCDVIVNHFGYTRDTYPIEHRHTQPGDIHISAADITRHAGCWDGSRRLRSKKDCGRPLHGRRTQPRNRRRPLLRMSSES